MRKSLNKKFWSRILIAVVISLLTFTLVLSNSAMFKEFFKLEKQNDDSSIPSGKAPATDYISSDPPLYLASTIEDNKGVSKGTDGTAGYPLQYNDVDAGKYHMLIADKDGFVFSRGSNYSQQLGLGTGTLSHNVTDTSSYFLYPQPVIALNNYHITKVAAGGYHSLAIGYDPALGSSVTHSNFKVFSWGSQESGRLGNAVSTGATGVPQDISGRFTAFAADEFPTDISAGEHHSMLLTNKGNIFTWGSNWYGQLGLNLAAGSAANDRNTPQKITNPSGVVYTAISAGSVHSLALAGTKIYSWGGNTNCQLGENTTTTAYQLIPKQVFTSNNFTYISAGELHNIAMNGTAVYGWGDRRGGKLGGGVTSNDPTYRTASLQNIGTYNAASAGGGCTLLLHSSGKLWVTGYGSPDFYGISGYAGSPKETSLSLGATGVIDAGGTMSLLISSTNEMFSIGSATHYSENWYASTSYWSDTGANYSDGSPVLDNDPPFPQYNITIGSNDTLKHVMPLTNIIGLPTDHPGTRHTLSNTINVKDGVTITTNRLKINSFHSSSHGDLAITQVTREAYDNNNYAGTTFTAVGSKGAIVSREGYYFVRFKKENTVTYRKFCISNKSGPEISLDPDNYKNVFAAIKLYDAFGLKSVSVNGQALIYGGSGEAFTASKSFPTSPVASLNYTGSFEITKNSQTNFQIVATDVDNNTTTVNWNIDTVVYLVSQGYTKEYDGYRSEVEPLYYTKARNVFSKSTFDSIYTGYTASGMTYTGGDGYSQTYAPIDASPNNYNATYSITKPGMSNLPTKTVTIKINKTVPIITAQSTPIFYGQSLSAADLKGTAVNRHNSSLSLALGTIEGSFYWPSNLLSVITEELYTSYTGNYTVTFKPTEGTNSAKNYEWANVTVGLTINKTTPVLSEVTSESIVYESPLSAATVSGSTVNPYKTDLKPSGSWSWYTSDFPAGAIQNLNRPQVDESGVYPVKFTPSDTDNYTDAYSTAQLEVTRKDQEIKFDALTSYNSSVKDEELAKDKADFQVSLSEGTITLIAYTSALYPTPRKITFTSSNVYIASIGPATVDVVTINDEIKSRTTVTLTLKQTGIVTISAEQRDYTREDTDPMDGYAELGNYNRVDSISKKLYIKKAHVPLNFNNITKEYGDQPFNIEPVLNSGLSDFTLVSNNSNILSLSSELTMTRTATIVNAGTARLTLQHPGYIDPMDETNAYVSMSAIIDVVINPTPLNIKLNNLSVVYGSAPNFSYTYTGLKYGEDPAVKITGLTNNYSSVTMRDVIREGEGYGSYTVTPYGAANSSAQFINYVISYTPGQLTITPATITATIENTSKVYGDNNPVVPINYSGFFYEETISSPGIGAPLVSLGDVGKYSNVGDYPITLYGGYANNYVFDTTDTAILTITRKPVNITSTPVSYEYNGLAAVPNSVVTGIDSEFATEPANLYTPGARIYEYSLKYSEDWSSTAPANAGTYHLRVTYIQASYDNYATTSKVFSDHIVITPTNPRLSMQLISESYTNSQIPAQAVVSPIPGGNTPAGTLRYQYSLDGVEFSDSAPVNAGTYDVKVFYMQATVDNYKDYSEVFEDILIINKINVAISLTVRNATYASSNGLTPDTVPANTAEAKGVGAETNTLPQTGRLTYKYFINGEWTTSPPYNAGSYSVMVTYDAYDNENYLDTTTTFNNRIIIAKADITDYITLETRDVFYSGSDVVANTAQVSGIPGGSLPMGTVSYEYQLGSSSYTPIPYKNANQYNVKVLYNSIDGDNYLTTSKTFTAALIIRKVNPRITLPEFKFEFDGKKRPLSGAASVFGIDGGSLPTGRISYRYLLGETWSTEGPRNQGVYTVEVTYTSGADDNYADYIIQFPNALTITKAKPELSLVPEKVEFTGSEIRISEATVRGKANDEDGRPEGQLLYNYYINGIWTTDAPVNSGSYNVKVIFMAAPESNYTDIEKIFPNALIIKNVAPNILLSVTTRSYTGYQIEAAEATIEGNAIYNGTFSYEYNQGNSPWTSRAPTEAGVYNVRVRYNEAAVDNYSTKTVVFNEYLIIEKLNIIVTPERNQWKVYDGQPIVGSTISFTTDKALIAGNAFSGTLTAGASKDAGDYLIKKGTLDAGNNYDIIFTENVIFTIRRAELKLIFPQASYVYDGKAKTPIIEVDPSSLIGNDTVYVYTTYEGNNINAGIFAAKAEIHENNYFLKEVRREYKIDLATMTNNLFPSYEVPYDKNPHRLVLTSKEEDAEVIYDGPTEYISRGTYTVKAIITKPNYHPEELIATLTITKGVHSFTVSAPTRTLYYNDPLPIITCDCSEGRIALDANQTLAPGQHEYTWTFTPDDIINYEIVTGKIMLEVQKAPTLVDIKGKLTQFSSETQSLQVNVKGTDNVVLKDAQIFFTNSTGEITTTMPTAPGRYTMSVVYAGDEHYAPLTYTTVLIIKEKANMVWVWALVGGIVVLVAASAIFFSHRKKQVIG